MVIDRDSLDRLAAEGFDPLHITRTDTGLTVVVADVPVHISTDSTHVMLRTQRPVSWAADDLDPEILAARASQLVDSIALRAPDVTTITMTPDLDRVELTARISATTRTPEDLVLSARNLAVLTLDTVGALAALEIRLTQDALGRLVLDDLDPFAASEKPRPAPPPPSTPAPPIPSSAPPATPTPPVPSSAPAAAPSEQPTLIAGRDPDETPADPPPPPGDAAGWYPDPRSEARWRYFDGSRWTDHTSDGS